MPQLARHGDILRLAQADLPALSRLLAGFGLELIRLPSGAQIPGSYWGDNEAGLQDTRLLARPDTPLHSILHEASHFICMDPTRRAALDRDAGGDDAEESAVCYLQVLLGEAVGVGRERMFADMDAWGYSFRLGNTRAWFEGDAADAVAWLRTHGVLDTAGRLTGAPRAS